jgi:hypothetical protein
LTFLSSLASSLQLSFGRDEMLTHPAKINFHKTSLRGKRKAAAVQKSI